MVTLRNITEENFYEVIKLKLHHSQEKFVSTNVLSLAECYLYRNNDDVFPYAIYAEEKVVGFVLLYSDDDEKSMTVWRIMIDASHQNKGYGKETFYQLTKLIKSYNKYDCIFTTLNQENNIARKLYESLGFIEKMVNEHNEIVMVKELTY